MKSIGTLADMTAKNPSEAITPPGEIEQRLSNLERAVQTVLGEIVDIQKRLDSLTTAPPAAPPEKQKKVKATPKKKEKKAPSEIITRLLKSGAKSRLEMEQASDLSAEQISKCVGWMKHQDMITKTKEKDAEGNSRWKLS